MLRGCQDVCHCHLPLPQYFIVLCTMYIYIASPHVPYIIYGTILYMYLYMYIIMEVINNALYAYMYCISLAQTEREETHVCIAHKLVTCSYKYTYMMYTVHVQISLHHRS